MSALSPDRSGVPVWLMIAICLEQEDQQQAPVAAEKQRNAMRRRAFSDAGVRSDRMRPLLSGTIPCANRRDDGARVNEMAIHCYRRDASAVLCTRHKRKRNDFWKRKAAG
jgi:hypothetical protein